MEQPKANSKDSAPTGDMKIEGDLRCVACGYNLKTLFAAARCPECGSRVSKSVSGGVLEDDPTWLVKVRGGAALLAWFPGLTLIGFILACLIQAIGASASGLLQFEWLVVLGNSGVGLVLFVLYCVGAYQVTAPATRKSNSGSWFRTIARFGGLPVLIGLVAILTTESHRLEPALLCGLVVLLAWWFVGLSGYARFLAKAGGDGELQRFSRIVLWASIAVLVPPVWGTAWFYINVPGGLSAVAPRGFGSQMGVIGLAFEPVLLFVVFVMLSVLMNGTRQMIDRSIDAQRGAGTLERGEIT